MKNILLTGSSLLLFLLVDAIALNHFTSPAQSQSNSAQIIELTQTGCQFLETESKNHNFVTTKAEDCKKFNNQTLSQRKSEFKPLSLPTGEYIFRVTNQNVPYSLGFYLRGQGLGKLTLPNVSGGGLSQNTTKDYVVTLTKGKYWISCPLNPTPDYPLVVY